MSKVSFILICLGVFIFYACNSVENKDLQQGYFELEEYFDEVLKTLGAPNVLQLVEKDGELSDSMTIKEYSLEEDFSTFKKGDISATSNIGKYDVEDKANGDARSVIYKLKPKFNEQVKRLDIFYDGQEVDSIYLIRSFESVIADIHLEAKYKAGKKYSINSILKDKINGSEVAINKRVIFLLK